MASVHKDFARAVAAYQAGQIARAEELCRQVVAVQPSHADAASLLAVLCCQSGRLEDGVAWAERVLKVRPADGQAWEIKGDALHLLGRFADAAPCFARALRADSRRGALWAKQGAALSQAGDVAGALAAYAQAMTLPGLTADMVGDYGLVLAEDGQHGPALDHLIQAIRAGHRTGAVWAGVARELTHAGRDAEAEDAYRQALALGPGDVGAGIGLGLLLMKRGELDAAHGVLDQAVRLDATRVDGWISLGAVLQRLGRFGAAADAARQAIALAPDEAMGHSNLGCALQSLGDLDGALAAHRRAAELNPALADIHANLGRALQAAGRDAEALAAMERGVALAADIDWCNLNLATLRLALGDWERGWPGYASRHGVNNTGRLRDKLGLPVWNGAPVTGGRLLVLAEQGIGDEIMFAGLLPRVLARTPWVVMTCDARLIAPLARAFPTLTLLPRDGGTTLPADVAAQVFLGDLPGCLRPDHDGAGPWLPAPYLVADAARRRDLRAGYGDRPVIGLAWASSSTNGGAGRTLDLAALKPLLDLDHVTWVSLQYGAAAQAARGAHPNLIIDDRVDQMADLDGFIAQVDAMDAVVTIDNSTVHVAGALAKPTLVLLPADPDWRWGRDGDIPVWYDAMTLLRRPFDGAWAGVVDRAVAAVVRWFPPGE